jgi:hypothetical protein
MVVSKRKKAGYVNYEKKKQKLNDKYENNEIYERIPPIDEEENTYFEDNSFSIHRKSFKNSSTQTTNWHTPYSSDTMNSFSFENIKDIIDLLVDSCGEWSNTSYRILSIMIYLLMRVSGIKYEFTKYILQVLNLHCIYSCSSWVQRMVDEDDLAIISEDKRGKFDRTVMFYELHPELELEAKNFALENIIKKEASFIARDLANFVNQRYYALYCPSNIEPDSLHLIRSVESIRCDLKRWGAKWDDNKGRPYFEGHERDDVVVKRNEFIDYFLTNKELYYYTKTENGTSFAHVPKPPNNILPKIVLSHDESTFRSGEVPPKRWMFPELMPFFNKGRGRSIMVSAFIMLHFNENVFELDEDEWKEAVAFNPELNKNDDILNYYNRSANAWIQPQKDNYMDNEVFFKYFSKMKLQIIYSLIKSSVYYDNLKDYFFYVNTKKIL